MFMYTSSYLLHCRGKKCTRKTWRNAIRHQNVLIRMRVRSTFLAERYGVGSPINQLTNQDRAGWFNILDMHS